MRKCFGRCRCLLGMLLIAMTLLQSREIVLADTPDHLGETIDGSILTDDMKAEDTAQTLLRYSHLYRGTIEISNNGNGYVGIYGTTQCYVTCDKVRTYLYLERSKGDGNFASYKSWEYSATNTNILTKSFSYKVEKGYYYRLRGFHSCTEDGTAESLGTCTNGIYIG